MNIYLIVIMFILVSEYVLDLVTEHLNLKRLTTELPKAFAGIYDPEKYAASQNYTRENSRIGTFQSTVQLFIIIPFILLGGFNYVDQWVRGLGYNSIITGVIYIFLLFLLFMLLELPFSIYDTFVIEEKYGFNKTTVRTYLLDLLKSAVLLIVVGAPILALVLWFFETRGAWAPFYIWGIITLFQLVMSFLAPAVILPLFNKFVPLEEGDLKSAIANYAKVHNFQLEGIYKMDGSKRSTKANAAFTGFGKFRRIILYDTLIEKHTTDELLVILAHEMGHYKMKHITKTMVISFLETGFMFYILSLFLGNRLLFDAFQMQEISVYGALIFFGFLYTPISMVFAVLSNMFSRRMEYQADHYAVTTTGLNDALAMGLKKLSMDNLSNLTPHPLKVFFYYQHPPVPDRIAAIERNRK